MTTTSQTVTYHTEDGLQVTLPASLDCASHALDDYSDASGARQYASFTPPLALQGWWGRGPYPLHLATRTLWHDGYSTAPWALWDPDSQLIRELIDAPADDVHRTDVCGEDQHGESFY